MRRSFRAAGMLALYGNQRWLPPQSLTGTSHSARCGIGAAILRSCQPLLFA